MEKWKYNPISFKKILLSNNYLFVYTYNILYFICMSSMRIKNIFHATARKRSKQFAKISNYFVNRMP